jgi:hypothetical protein
MLILLNLLRLLLCSLLDRKESQHRFHHSHQIVHFRLLEVPRRRRRRRGLLFPPLVLRCLLNQHHRRLTHLCQQFRLNKFRRRHRPHNKLMIH